MLIGNNATLNGALENIGTSAKVYLGVFAGTAPDAAELSALNRTASETLCFCPADIRTLVNQDVTRKPLLEMMSSSLDFGFSNGSRIVFPLAPDPVEFTFREAGTASFFVLYSAPVSVLTSSYDNASRSAVRVLAIGSVGAVGSGADMEILDGIVAADRDYKANDILINVVPTVIEP